jgi:hypothetical protein
VDGTPAALDPLGPDAVEAGRVTMTIEALCDADGDVPTSSMVSEGSHRLTARATLWDRSVVESGSIDVTLDCDDAVDHTSGGCSLVQPRGPADGTTGWVLAAAGVAVVLGRRRASRR